MSKLYVKAKTLCWLLCFVSAWAFSQEVRVSGQVTDARTGEAMPGVNVIVKGTSSGTVTDSGGEFILTASPGAILQFSFIGFTTKEAPVSSDRMQIAMDEDVLSLEEVVVSGLASTVKRSNLANAVATVSSSELMGTTGPQTVDNALYGKIPGVNMNANGGAPGGGINVQLRGISTLGAGSSQPLYIIDGVYVNNSTIRSGRSQVNQATGGQSASNQDDASNRIADINPDDIERIEVLKGPSAAAIYGTRANAGVIIITTKKGRQGKPRITLNQKTGWAEGQNFQNFDTWDQNKITTYFSASRQPAELAAYNQAVSEGRVTDWEREVYGEKPLLTNTELSVSGGTENTIYYVSAGLQDEGGIIKNTGFSRYSVRANVEQKIGKRFTFTLNNNYVKTETDRGFTGNQNNTGGSLGYALAYTPSYANLFPDAQGNYPANSYFNDNPLAIRDLGINNLVVTDLSLLLR